MRLLQCPALTWGPDEVEYNCERDDGHKGDHLQTYWSYGIEWATAWGQGRIFQGTLRELPAGVLR